MAEILYTVAVSFTNPQLVDPWLKWLREGHIAAVLTGGATDAEIVLLDSPAHSYEIRYRFSSRGAFALYERDHAPRLRAEGLQLFPPEKGVVYRRSVGVVCESYAQV
jgi:hypothetical protein